MKAFVARGYCGQQSFVFQPHSNVEVISKVISGQEQLHIKAGEVNIRITRKQWSRETDHYHDTDYLCYRVTVKLEEAVLVDQQVAEFLLHLDGDTLILGVRKAPSVRVDHQSRSSGHCTVVHLITTTGLYRKLETQECEGCKTEDRMTQTMHGCNTCLTQHMGTFKKESA